jgi:hypothetical protein
MENELSKLRRNVVSAYRKLMIFVAGLLLAAAGFLLTGTSGAALADCGWDTPSFMSATSQN